MWYEENNQFIRAPTPKTFDTMVQNLEDGDSVMFQSISLPSTKKQENVNNTSSSTKNDINSNNDSHNSSAWKSILNTQEEDKPKGRSSSTMATISPSGLKQYDDGDDDDDDYNDDEEIRQIKRQITQAEIENARRDKMIQSKDEQIESLQRQIKSLQGSPARATTSQSRRPVNDSDLIQFYKNQYETTLSNYQKLKEVLSLSANVSSNTSTKQAQSARPAPARKLVKKQ